MVPSVLLVDSDTDSITIYTLILKHRGFEVIAATDTSTGYRLAVELRPDVVVSEVFLPPEDNGRTLMQQLREDIRTSRTPLIILDSVPTFSDPGAADQAPTARLTKPCTPSRLVMEVEKLLGLGPKTPAL